MLASVDCTPYGEIFQECRTAALRTLGSRREWERDQITIMVIELVREGLTSISVGSRSLGSDGTAEIHLAPEKGHVECVLRRLSLEEEGVRGAREWKVQEDARTVLE